MRTLIFLPQIACLKRREEEKCEERPGPAYSSAGAWYGASNTPVS